MIKVYTGKNGFGIIFLFIAGMILFLSIFFWGITDVIQLFLPLLIVLSYLLIIIFALGFLPATYFKGLRPTLSVYSLLMAHALGVATWMLAFFYVVKNFGLMGIFLAFLFQFLAPLAIAGAVLKGSWHIVEHLALWISFTYGMRYYSRWVVDLIPQRQEKSRIIDVDAIEIREP